jgi:hypothetical protein
MLSCSSPIFALSNHTTFSQTQTGATVPLSITRLRGNAAIGSTEKSSKVLPQTKFYKKGTQTLRE